jgi:hypothetical protein
MSAASIDLGRIDIRDADLLIAVPEGVAVHDANACGSMLNPSRDRLAAEGPDGEQEGCNPSAR